RLIEAPHALFDSGARHERRTLEGQTEHLKVRHVETPADIRRMAGAITGLSDVAVPQGDISLMKREPTVIRLRVKCGDQAARSLEPSVRDGKCAAEVELVGGKPGCHSGCARRVSPTAIEAKRALARIEGRLRVIEPPGRPAQSLQRLWCFLSHERRREPLAGRFPSGLSKCLPSVRARALGPSR